MKWPTDAGYAITALERLFFSAAVELAGGDESRVHFAYPDTSAGPPASLPEGFPNVVKLSIEDRSNTAMRALADHLRQINADLVITFDVQPTHPAFVVMRQNGVATIVSYWGAPISGLSHPLKRVVKRVMLRLSRSRADGLIFESRAMADLAIKGRGVPLDMIDIVPLGVDTQRFRPEPSDYVYSKLGIPRDRKVVVFSGHCTTRKGIGTLIEAAIELLVARGRTDVCFLICGDREDQRRPFEAMYVGLGIDESIRFAGYRSDLLHIFQSAFCGVIPSSGWDSFTLSSVEMAATGLPVVASRLQGLAEAVVHGETGLLFEPGNAHALADAIASLLDDPERARAYGLAGRRRAEQELTVKRQRERFLEAIRRRLPRSMLASHPPGPRPARAAADPNIRLD
jgi:glycosyltransferase involved in cell wall biosynthesis